MTLADRLAQAAAEQAALYNSGLSSSHYTVEQVNAAKQLAKGTTYATDMAKIEYFLANGEWPKEEK